MKSRWESLHAQPGDGTDGPGQGDCLEGTVVTKISRCPRFSTEATRRVWFLNGEAAWQLRVQVHFLVLVVWLVRS